MDDTQATEQHSGYGRPSPGKRAASLPGREPLLSQDEELALVQRLNHSSPTTEHERARDALILGNLRLVTSIARSYQGNGLSLEDLKQEGIIGLIRAIDGFDASKDLRLSTYAFWWIRHMIQQAIATQGRLIRIPVSQTRKALPHRAQQRHSSEQERADGHAAARQDEPDPPDLSALNPLSLDEPAFKTQGIRIADAVRAPEEAGPYYLTLQRLRQQALYEALLRLPDAHREVLVLRYGLLGEPPRSVDQVSAALKLTRQRVRLVELRGLNELRSRLSMGEHMF